MGHLSTGRSAHSATLLPSDKVLVVGGQTADSSLGATSELFDPATSTWSPAGSMDAPRQSHTATLLRGKVLVTGGYNPQTGIQSSAEVYEPGSGWKGFSASMNVDRYKHTATRLDADSVLLVGGFSNADQSATTAEIYYQP
ncbi:Kelch repeat-containing protein [Cystobacter fuscus]|uniref:Kelch repeat-containing protein n=1 Tax=Cystobacter fuscus TaxID=43 RepID=UPI000BB3E247|nr:kelch repeat-containing protein [Cystobacter fuscus]